MKSLKPNKEWHTSNSSKGMGDFYGTGLKAKVGRVRDNYDSPVPSGKLNKPPKNLA